MVLRRHPSATCNRCDSALYYRYLEESTGWQISVTCDPEKGCGRDVVSKRAPRHHVDRPEEARAVAKRLAGEL
ncbi:hypothetical protein AArcSl_2190 [Halalkaliarchaeum desulfuricum]|uniref:Uncharacterized protein n=1 Tax=Halalkaliarchaeum desulfuricum TaxID=2055893 RepID=A0A343TL43_9EURY|nr:hypothetical protein [Halalkaliarchaeum desulfuricum]AUX09815.1 hypothetical protein AArcSl_2190 [Halalkaliarchaeum desulfuricum]